MTIADEVVMTALHAQLVEQRRQALDHCPPGSAVSLGGGCWTISDRECMRAALAAGMALESARADAAEATCAELRHRIAELEERQRWCSTMDYAEKLAIVRALQEVMAACGIDTVHSSPAQAVAAVRQACAEAAELRRAAEASEQECGKLRARVAELEGVLRRNCYGWDERALKFYCMCCNLYSDDATNLAHDPDCDVGTALAHAATPTPPAQPGTTQETK